MRWPLETFLLLYEPIPARSGSWMVLLQQQAVAAAVRAVLADQQEQTPAWSGNLLLAPCDIEILPLLALAAHDFASFAEPEARERPQAPIILYNEGSWPPEVAGDPEEMRHLLHPAWFVVQDLALNEAVLALKPRTCISVMSARRTRNRLAEISWTFERVVYFETLSVDGDERPSDLPASFSAADRQLAGRISRSARVPGIWESMLGEGESPDLEPFIAFGAAVEMAIWGSSPEPVPESSPFSR